MKLNDLWAAGVLAEYQLYRDDGTDSWPSVRGPIGACFLSLNRVGWTRKGPTEWVDDGRSSEGPHAILAQALYVDNVRIHAEIAREKTCSVQGHESLTGRRACVDHVRRFIKSKTKTRVEQIVVSAAATNSIWTLWRLFQAGYIVLDTMCPMCKACHDTLRSQALDMQLTLWLWHFGRKQQHRKLLI